MAGRRRGNRQPELFPRSKRPTVPIEENHRLVLLADEVDWTELVERAEEVRRSKLKSGAGRPPHLRALVGALLLKATRDMTWREAEDQIRHYAPARYLCGLTETDWTPDFTTLHDFAILLGEDGVRLLNEYTVEWAVAEKMADPSVVVGDTTAQEAAIPYPNEMGLMAAFMTTVGASCRRGGTLLKEFWRSAGADVEAAKVKMREYRLFAKERTKAVKNQMVAAMANVIAKVNAGLADVLGRARQRGTARLVKLSQTMTKLLPQIRYWLRTGFVAANKVISLHVPELYSIVRGKVGKAVEFGLNWGITRLRGGFLRARVARSRGKLTDSKFAVLAVEDHIALFGKTPRAFAYDRGGYSENNVKALQSMGVKEVGLAPRGAAAWAVDDAVRRRLVKERALIEAGIGAVKSTRYNFHRPRAKSVRMMGAAGQLGVLGFNLNKLVRGFAERRKVEVAG